MITQGTTINHSSPDLGDEEVEALVACVRSLQIKGGSRVRVLESEIAEDLGYAGAVATTTGSQAIHLALRALFSGNRAVVGLPSYVCRSVYDAVCLAGCRPYLFDIDENHFSVAQDQITRSPIDAIVVPHMFGIRAPVEKYNELGIPVIEDCSQRLPPLEVGRHEPKALIRVLSFEATKLVTSGEGGVLLSEDIDLIHRVQQFRDGPYDFPEPALWLPYTDLQAAIALVQWHRLPEILEKRRRLAHYYLSAFDDHYEVRVVPAMRRESTYHFRFVLWADKPDVFVDMDCVDPISKNRVLVRRPVAPIPLHELYPSADGVGAFPVTDDALAHLISIPLYPRLSAEEASTVVASIRAVQKLYETLHPEG